MMELNRILLHDALQPWPVEDCSINTIVTSPPYWALRDYGIEGQLGMEDTPEEYIVRMVQVFREAHRVLRDDGTMWINIGDTYFGGKGANGATDWYQRHSNAINKMALLTTQPGEFRPNDRPHPFLKPKDLVGIPWMLAFALRADGWYLRQDIIWHKPNPMPESTNDRCTKAHEYLFLFSKSRKYYFDAFSIATPFADKTYTTFGTERSGKGDDTGLIKSENWARNVPVRKPKEWKTPDGWDTRPGSHGNFHGEGREKGAVGKSGNKKRKSATERGCPSEGVAGSVPWEGDRANKRSVWTVATAAFKEAHFATFPPALIIDCIKAGCPAGGTILDRFMGAGTTALVASKLGRNYLGLELNPEYIAIAEKRLRDDLGLFNPSNSNDSL